MNVRDKNSMHSSMEQPPTKTNEQTGAFFANKKIYASLNIVPYPYVVLCCWQALGLLPNITLLRFERAMFSEKPKVDLYMWRSSHNYVFS